MINSQKYPNNTRVYHWDLFCGWEPAVVIGGTESTITLKFDGEDEPFEAEDEFVHLTRDNSAINLIFN